ncbi:putative tellurite resistance protein [Klebsiella pneumoniae]|uniref:Putative tellurite resistance protein n=1 Tax=Klebsiella pneumoniae TaxID=573 RepID=A0A2X1QI27_KLEPN|nr:putative tellurite resistance protein [Klebsiella pneumoniae]
MPMKPAPSPLKTLTIEAGQFGVFPPEKWHCIEALSEDTVLMSTFMLIQKFSSKDNKR